MAETPRIFANHPIKLGEICALSAEDSIHILGALRLRVGDEIEIVSNNKVYVASLVSADKNNAYCQINSEILAEQISRQVDLIFAHLKSDHDEFILEKGTELGVNNFYVFQATNSIRAFNLEKLARYERIILSAASQSKRSSLPKIQALPNLTALSQTLNTIPSNCKRIAGIIGSDKKLSQLSSESNQFITITGPEGDFSPEEIEFLKQNQFQAVNLGPTRLKAETAAIAIAAGLLVP